MAAPLVLIAAALLRIPARRIRALALGDDAALRDWLANESATRLAEARRDARAAAARLADLGGRIVALGDEAYPAGLRDLADPPPFLCARGALAPAGGPAGTAIVGSRTPSAAHAALAAGFAAVAPGPIVSGLALGVPSARSHTRRWVARPARCHARDSANEAQTRRVDPAFAELYTAPVAENGSPGY